MNSARVLAATLLIPALQAPVAADNLATLPPSESILVLERTSRQLSRTGDPIWNLRLESPGEPALNFEAVTGRAHRQDADRHIAGTRAPLPAGRYSLGRWSPSASGSQ